MKEKILKFVRHKPLLRKILSKIYLNYIKIWNLCRKTEFQKIYSVNPENIQMESWKYFNIFKQEGTITWGDWDINAPLFKNNTIFRWLSERFIKKLDWEETSYFKEFIKKIESGKLMWNCSNKEEFLIRCNTLDEIYNDIKINGYTSNKDPITGWYDEVSINIGRKWELLFNDGAHRLTMAKLLQLNSIPVRIIARHSNWYNLIKYLRSVLPKQESYQSLWHIDLDTNFTIHHPCYNRFQLFKDYLPQVKSQSKSLDIWWNIGFFTRELEKLGFNAYIIEHESFYIKILQKFKEFLWFKYTIIDEDMFEWKGFSENKFEVVLALNIFHHFIKTESFYKKLVQLLNKLNTNVIIFESHDPSEEQMSASYKNYSPEEFVQFIMKETGLTKYEEIWMIEADKRRVFKIYK